MFVFCLVVFAMSTAHAVANTKTADKNRKNARENAGLRRLADDGGVEVADRVCEHVTEIVRNRMQGDFVRLLTEHVGEAQDEALLAMKATVVEFCMQELEADDAMQCKFYLELLPLVDAENIILKAALVDAFGSIDDRDHGCKAVVNTVNEKIEDIAETPDSPIHIDDDNRVYWKSGEQSEVIVFRDGLSRRRLMNVKDLMRTNGNDGAIDLSCAAVGGVAAAVASGATMMAVAVGTMCKAFATHSAPRFVDYVPL